MDKKGLLIIGIAVLIVAILGLGAAGIIPIPGLTKPKVKKKPAAVAEAPPPADKKDGKATTPPATPDPSKTVADDGKTKDEKDKATKDSSDPDKATNDALAAKAAAEKQINDEKGYKKLAGVWAEMKPDEVGKLILDHYKPEDVAPILKLMDEDQVAAIFSAMAAKKPEGITPSAKGPDIGAYSDALAKEVSKPDLVAAAKS